MTTFNGFPKEDFRERMIKFWLDTEGDFFNHSRQRALDWYGGDKFDALCERCDGTTLLSFDTDCDGETCFETVDNDYAIPVSAIVVYS